MLHLKSVRRDHGFSLIELIVVVGIMAALALVGVPWLLKIGQRNSLKSAAREIQTTLLAARVKAVKRNAPVSVQISTLGPPIELVTIEPPVPTPPAPTPGVTLVPIRLQLPSNSAVMYATPAAAGGTITFGGDGRVSMATTPPPTPGAYEYVLRGPVGVATPNQISVQAWPSGRIVVVTPTNWY
jgi:prepilin-type N-terminal cleavage/methylation domain-containing protein